MTSASYRCSINAETTIESKPILYGKTTIEGTQDYAISGYMYEDSKDVYKESYIENKTKLIIVKKEYGTENRLSGVKFNIFDNQKRMNLLFAYLAKQPINKEY